MPDPRAFTGSMLSVRHGGRAQMGAQAGRHPTHEVRHVRHMCPTSDASRLHGSVVGHFDIGANPGHISGDVRPLSASSWAQRARIGDRWLTWRPRGGPEVTDATLTAMGHLFEPTCLVWFFEHPSTKGAA